ncbi:uncharacterized protein LOC124275197 [Haliotis rubra]|uniref:uncharacterized protein LOC124275197 n=1 Tax=Haliotis rubra TaxID=36100 RepID=UPI001EE5A5D1|nr:uncharacterized protein LOC124275197 [Haliotis rubra]
MKLPEDDTRATRILLTFQGQRALEELINTFGGLASSLNMDHIPDSQPTSQELMTMTLRERQANEETIKKEREEHRSQTEKQNEEAEACKLTFILYTRENTCGVNVMFVRIRTEYLVLCLLMFCSRIFMGIVLLLWQRGIDSEDAFM